MRMSRVDLVKGGLIILVIAGHLLPGEFHANLARWIIYSFHMPLFTAVSGYLFSWEKMREFRFADVVRKYWRRPVLPWLVALAVYAAVDTAPGSLLSAAYWAGFLGHFIRPFFHLWFIAAYLFWVLLSWALLHLRLSLPWILLTGSLLSFGSELLRHWIPPLTGNHFSGADTFLYTLHPNYYVFFVLGGFFRRYNAGLPVGWVVPATLLLLTAEVLLFYYPNEPAEAVVFFLYNFCLIRLMVAFVEGRPSRHYRLPEWIGVHSLAIYLWHVLPLIIVFRLHLASALQFYLLNAALMTVLFLGVWMTARIRQRLR